MCPEARGCLAVRPVEVVPGKMSRSLRRQQEVEKLRLAVGTSVQCGIYLQLADYIAGATAVTIVLHLLHPASLLISYLYLASTVAEEERQKSAHWDFSLVVSTGGCCCSPCTVSVAYPTHG